MRIIILALFMLIMQVSAGLMNVSGLFSEDYSVTPQVDWATTNKQAVEEGGYTQNLEVSEPSIFDSVLDVLKGLWNFIKVVGWSVISIPWTLSQFGVPAELVWWISIPAYTIYLLAIAEWIGNKNTEGMH